jgi:hypothetical protein
MPTCAPAHSAPPRQAGRPQADCTRGDALSSRPPLLIPLPVTGPRPFHPAWPAVLLCAWMLAAPVQATTPPVPAGKFTFYGLAPAVAGLDRTKAEAALGQPLQPEPVPPGRAASAAAAASAKGGHCHHRLSAQQPGVRFTLTGDVITRAETRDARYATVSGVSVGNTVAQAQKAYGKRLNTAPHPYFAQGKVLTVYSPDRKFALVMESNDQGRIITLRGGRLPEVGWLEGCA